MKLIRIELMCGYIGDAPIRYKSFRQRSLETPEELTERVAAFLVDSMDELTKDIPDENE